MVFMAPQVLNIMREKECHVDVLLFLCCIVVTHVEFPPAPPITKPQPFSVGVFSCPLVPAPACGWGFLRIAPVCLLARSWPFFPPASLCAKDPKSAAQLSARQGSRPALSSAVACSTVLPLIVPRPLPGSGASFQSTTTSRPSNARSTLCATTG